MANHSNRFSILNQTCMSHSVSTYRNTSQYSAEDPEDSFVDFWGSLSIYLPLLYFFQNSIFFFCLIHSVRTHILPVILSLYYHPETAVLLRIITFLHGLFSHIKNEWYFRISYCLWQKGKSVPGYGIIALCCGPFQHFVLQNYAQTTG